MKKVINGRLYDTDTAICLGCDGTCDRRDLFYVCEALFQKKNKEFFLYGEGGPASKYAVDTGSNSWSGGETILPLTEAEARKWAELHLTGDDYIEIFGEVQE